MRRPPVFERLAIAIRELRACHPREYSPILTGEWLQKGGGHALAASVVRVAWTGFPVAIEPISGHGRTILGIDAHVWICADKLRLVRREVFEQGDGRAVVSRKLVLCSIDDAGGARELVRLCEEYRLDPERVLAAVRDEVHRHRRVQRAADGAPLPLAS